MGFLMYRDTLWVCVRSNKTDRSMMSGFKYVRGGSDHLPDLVEPSTWRGADGWLGAAVRCGSSFHCLPDPRVLDPEWGVQSVYDPALMRSRYYPDDLVSATFGELRTFLALLLLLNQPQRVRLQAVPARRGDARSRNRPYAAHSVVDLTLGETREYIKYLRHSDRASPRRHEVRGHFTHRNCQKGCEHEWPVLPQPHPRTNTPTWRCARCGGLRSWKKAHERGDASTGFVTKEYVVDY